MYIEFAAQARALLEGITPGPWEAGDHYHVQGASHCQCRPDQGPLVKSCRMDINGEMMKAHIHRADEPWWPLGVMATDDGRPVNVLVETEEYGVMTAEDRALVAAAPDLAATVIVQAEEIARLKSIITEHEPDRAQYRAMSVDKGVEYANGWEDCAISIRTAVEGDNNE